MLRAGLSVCGYHKGFGRCPYRGFRFCPCVILQSFCFQMCYSLGGFALVVLNLSIHDGGGKVGPQIMIKGLFLPWMTYFREGPFLFMELGLGS